MGSITLKVFLLIVLVSSVVAKCKNCSGSHTHKPVCATNGRDKRTFSSACDVKSYNCWHNESKYRFKIILKYDEEELKKI